MHYFSPLVLATPSLFDDSVNFSASHKLLRQSCENSILYTISRMHFQASEFFEWNIIGTFFVLIAGCWNNRIPLAPAKMNRREDPLLRQHRNRLLQLAEVTNIKPGRGSGKRRGQRQSHGFGPRSARKTVVMIVGVYCTHVQCINVASTCT